MPFMPLARLIVEKGDRLTAFLTHKPDDQMNLSHWDRDAFRAQDTGIGDGPLLTFQLEPGGQGEKCHHSRA
ncbi:MAG: hypothetical protein LLG06_16895 [Desulfobacteraceae bacterium]|nr:hypothetical protein [Desulfobacteraceae bacterium]